MTILAFRLSEGGITKLFSKKGVPLFLWMLVFCSTKAFAVSNDWYSEALKFGEGGYYLSDDSAILAWNETYYQRVFLDLYEMDGDTNWLNKMVNRIDVMISNMRDVPPESVPCNREVYEDGFLGWGTTRYDPNGYYQEYFVHDGMITVPIASFIQLVYEDTSLYLIYGAKADSFLRTIENQIIAKWYTNWEGNLTQSGITLEEWGGWEHIPNNQYLVFGSAMLILCNISESPYYIPADTNFNFPNFYLEQSTEMANTFKNYLTHDEDNDAYLWSYWSTYPPAEDLSHGCLDIEFVLMAYHNGIAFDTIDMNRFANTFTELIWNNDFDNPVLSRLIDGSSPENWGQYSWAWIYLSEFDFLVWEIANAYCEANPKKWRINTVATLAYAGQLYDIYPPAAPTSLTAVHWGSVVNLTWTGPTVDADSSRLTGLAGYNIYQSDTQGGPYTQVNIAAVKDTYYLRIDTPGYYVVTAIDYHIPPNEGPYSEEATVIVAISEEVSSVSISPICLFQNYPNPFSSRTTISYLFFANSQDPRAKSKQHIVLKIYDITGKLVRTLVDENKPAGEYTVHWDCKNDGGEEIDSGVYFYRIEAGTFASTKKMVIAR